MNRAWKCINYLYGTHVLNKSLYPSTCTIDSLFYVSTLFHCFALNHENIKITNTKFNIFSFSLHKSEIWKFTRCALRFYMSDDNSLCLNRNLQYLHAFSETFVICSLIILILFWVSTSKFSNWDTVY